MTVLLIAGAAFFGCGADSGGSSTVTQEEGFKVRADTTITTATPPLSKPSFAARVNQFCRQAWSTIRREFAEYKQSLNPKLSSRRRFEESIRLSLLPGIKLRIFNELRLLGAPEGEASKIEKLASALAEAIEIGQRAFAIEDPALLWDLFDIFNPMARRYGLDECLVNRAHTQIR